MGNAEKVIFADIEGDNFLEDITKLWTIQIAEGVDAPVVVYADQEGHPPLSEGLKILRECDKVVFHYGIGFDFWAINKLYPNTLRIDQIIDSVIISRLMNASSNRHNLKELGERVGKQKGDFDDFSKFSPEMVKYGKRDVEILQLAWKGVEGKCQSFGAFYDTFREACENEFYCAYVIEKQVQHGFRYDQNAANELEAELRQESMSIIRELQEAFPPIIHKRVSEKTGKPLKDRIEVFNPASRDQIADRLIAKYGWKPKAKTPSKKPKVDEEILDSLPYPEAKLIARYMTLGKMLGQIADGDNAWQKLFVSTQKGDYVHGYVNTIGCRTHRMSHSKPNMAQVNKDPRMRRLWLPDPDHVLVGVDAEGLELRMLAHYLHPYDNGTYIEFVHSGDKKLGTDVHTMNMKAAGLFLRDSAKTMIYAHNYGCFDPKLGMIVIEDAKLANMPVPKGAPATLGAVLRDKIQVGIVGLGTLIEKCGRAHNKNRALPALDGRWIPSASEHSALNTLLQGNGSVVMKVALNEFDKEMERLQLLDKFGYCANVHDEFQLSVHPDVAQKAAEVGKWSITRAGEILGVRCPLVGDAASGLNWADTH